MQDLIERVHRHISWTMENPASLICQIPIAIVVIGIIFFLGIIGGTAGDNL